MTPFAIAVLTLWPSSISLVALSEMALPIIAGIPAGPATMNGNASKPPPIA